MVRKQIIKAVEYVFLNICPCHIQHKLMTKFTGISCIVMICPVGMISKQVAVLVYHLWLNPNTEIHTKLINIIDKFVKSVWKFVFINIPVAKSCTVVITLAEPTVIHNKKLNAHFGGNLSQCCLPLNAYIKFRSLPRIVKHRQGLIVKAFRQNIIDCKFMHLPWHFAKPLGVTAKYLWCFKFFSRF